MTDLGYAALREIVLDVIAPKIARANLNRGDFKDDTDLLTSGILDSFDFLDMIAAVEDRAGIEVDLATMDDDSFTTLRGFVRSLVKE